MIRQALLYFADPDDRAVAHLSVAGRPLAYRAIVTALRGGVERVGVPPVLRDGAVGRAITASPSAHAAVVWLEPASAWPEGPALLLPATALVPPPAVAALGGSPPPATLDAARAGGAPLLSADHALVRDLIPALTAGAPVGSAVRAQAAGAAAPARRGDLWYLRVTTPAQAREAERRLASTLGSPIDTRLDRLVHRRLSRPLSRLAVRWGLTPNHVTLLSLLVGLGAVWSFSRGGVTSALAGLGAYLAAVVLDHADGEVARLTLAESQAGEWLDLLADTTIHALLVAALGQAAESVAGGHASLTGWVAAAGVVASAMVEKASRPAGAADGVGSVLASLGNRDGYYAMLVIFVVLLGAAPGLLPAFMLAVAAGTHAYWAGRLAHRLLGRT